VHETLVHQIREFLRPHGMFPLTDGADDSITTKHGGHVLLSQTAEGLRTEIVRRDGTTGSSSPLSSSASAGRSLSAGSTTAPFGASRPSV
jgi:hypothetical protein